MKKTLFILRAIIISLLLSTQIVSANAQVEGDKVLIYYKNGTTVDEYSCTDIIKIANDLNNLTVYSKTFGEDIPLETPISEVDRVVFKFMNDEYIDVDIDDIKLADANASDATKILYAYMKYYYGKKIISSTTSHVNWNTDCAESVKNVTGKYPAITCYDFIHIPFDGTWINYSDITPVTNWADKGGVVSLMWHFNVPMTEEAFDTKDYTSITYDPEQTTWDMNNIYVDGTWENSWFYEQMDKVCEIILKLQDAGIVALWRPFHEASGNMLNTQGWPKKAWFWWGNEGGEAYIKLWKTMKTYFESKGIHNLIWIWTGTAATSTSEADTSYYPGDDFVDIIGCDCYGFSATELKAQYDGLSSLYPQKMITLAECGNLTETNGSTTTITESMSTISEMWNTGAKFLYFMPWSDYNYQEGNSTVNHMFPDEYWKDAMNMDDIINMDNWRKNENQE